MTFTGDEIGVPRIRVVIPFPLPCSTRTADTVFFLPDEGSVPVFGQPGRFVFCYDPSTENGEGDSPFCAVVESGPEVGVVTVPVP